ncbi:MAG: hypothetical protein PHS54_03265 [Clostridia bacterium]|nr:hypothetical protein [Clostridia bacterium]
MKCSKKVIPMKYKDWLSDELKEEVINMFEPLYKRTLTDGEVIEIANNLAGLAELWIKFNWRIKNKQNVIALQNSVYTTGS